MRIFLVLFTVFVAAIGLLFYSGKLAPVLPPEISLKNAGEEIDDRVFIDNEAMMLSVVPETIGLKADATLFLVGAPVQTIALNDSEARFKPVLLSPGRNEVAVRVQGRLGPIKLSRWHRLTVDATASGDDLALSVPKTVWTSDVKVSGTATPGASVTLRLREVAWDEEANSIRLVSETMRRVRTRSDGIFTVVLDLPNPGQFEIAASIEMQSDTNGSRQIKVSETKQVLFATQLPPLRERALIFLLERDGIRYQTRAVFERGDPRAEAILQGDLSSRAFQRAIHGLITVNGATFGSQWSSPLTAYAGADSIEVRSETRGIPDRVFSEGSVQFSRWSPDAPAAKQDSIEIRFKDRTVDSFFPAPETADKERVIWSNSSNDLPTEISLKMEPTVSLQAVWQLTPSSIFPNWLGSAYMVILTLVPLVWFLRIIGPEHAKGTLEASLRTTVLTLGTFAAFGSVAYLSGLFGGLVMQTLAVVFEFEPYQLSEIMGGFRAREIEVVAGFVALFALATIMRLLLPGRNWWQCGKDTLAIFQRALFWALLYNVAVSAIGRLWTIEGAVDYFATTFAWLTVFVVCAAIGVQLTSKLIETAQTASGRQFARPAWLTVSLALVLLFLIRPGEISYDPLIERLTRPAYDAFFAFTRFVNVIGSVAPLLVAFLVCSYLAKSPLKLTPENRLDIATLLFAGILVGTGRVWAIIPVPFLLALVIFPRIVLHSKARLKLLSDHRTYILSERSALLRREIDNALQYSASAGWFGLGLFGVRQEDQKRRRDYVPLKATFPDGTKISLPELALTFGRDGDALRNAVAAARVGAWGALFFVIIYAIPSFTETRVGNAFPYLDAVQRVVSVGGYWLISAFFFGYFFDRIKGSAGWKKGAILAIGILLAREPLALLSASSFADYSVVAIQVVQTVVFFVLLGLIAFDMKAYRKASGVNINWRAFPLITGLSVVEAFVSIVIATLGVAASTAFSGELTSVLGQVASEIIQSPVQPPLPGSP